jgi:hypothetical protein
VEHYHYTNSITTYLIDSVKDLENFENIIDDHSRDIRNMISRQHKDDSERQRKMLLPIVDNVTTL